MGAATLPANLQIGSSSSFTGQAPAVDWPVLATNMLPLTGAVIASLAVPSAFKDLLVVSANASPTPAPATEITVTDVGSGSDCVLGFSTGQFATANNCTVDLFGGKVVYPGPADITLTGTISSGNATLTNVDLGINTGNARGVVWFQRNSLARLTQPTTGHLGAISAGGVTGSILLTPPTNITTPLKASFIAWFDENDDGVLSADEVVSGDVKLGTDTPMSGLFSPTEATTLLAALETTSVNYIVVAVVQSPTGDLQKTTSIDVKASLSFTGTAALTK